MKVIVAKTAGFCMGVRRAVDMATGAAETGPAATFGPLVHNPQVVEKLAAGGVGMAQGLDQLVPPCQVVVRAHGAAKNDLEEMGHLGLTVVDATCPHVLRSRKLVSQAAAEGKTIVLVGDAGHAEVEGLTSWGQGRVRVISSCEEAEAISIKPPACVLAQTTFGRDQYDAITKALAARCPNIEVHDTICDATAARQHEVARLARQADILIVVGGMHSANTTRLAEIARASGILVQHVETAAQLDLDQLRQVAGRGGTAGVSAGASTPDDATQAVVDVLGQL